MFRRFWILFFRNALFFAIGFGAGYAACYFSPAATVQAIVGYRVVQSVFGIKSASDFPDQLSMFLTILASNAISTGALFLLGFLMVGPLASFLVGGLASLMLFTGPTRHGVPITLSVIVLFAIESVYRVLSVALGASVGRKQEYIPKHARSFEGMSEESLPSARQKTWPLALTVGLLVVALLLFGAYYETFLFK